MNGWVTYAFQLLNLGIIVWLFRRYFYPGMQEYLRRRSTAIVEELEAARRDRAEAQRLAERARESLDEARAQAAQLLETARREAGERGRRIEEEALARSEEMTRRAVVRSAIIEREALEKAQAQVASLVMGLTRSVIAAALDGQSQHQVVDRALAALQQEVGREPR